MDMKRKLREFFTLECHANDGFTLVELIVVIAIVAILGGVAVPAYSGYIEKADAAADAQLLADVNKAFAAACIVLGEDNYKAGGATATIDDKSGEVTVSYDVTGFDDAFESFYEGGAFKKTEELRYDPAIGGFYDPDAKSGNGGVFAQIFGSLDLGEYATALKESTFGKVIGADKLLEKVDIVTGLAAGLAEVNENFAASLAGTLPNLQATLDMGDEEFEAYMYGLLQEKAAQINPEDPTSDAAINAARNEILANYAVLNAAKSTVGKTENEIIANLKGGVSVNDIKNMMDKKSDATTQQEGMANAAMMYAMYTAYANGLPEGDAKNEAMSIIESNDIGTFVTTMANKESAQYAGFQDYLDTDKAKADVNGYLGAMNIINQSASTNPDAVGDLLMNGYDNDELASALQGLIG